MTTSSKKHEVLQIPLHVHVEYFRLQPIVLPVEWRAKLLRDFIEEIPNHLEVINFVGHNAVVDSLNPINCVTGVISECVLIKCPNDQVDSALTEEQGVIIKFKFRPPVGTYTNQQLLKMKVLRQAILKSQEEDEERTRRGKKLVIVNKFVDGEMVTMEEEVDDPNAYEHIVQQEFANRGGKVVPAGKQQENTGSAAAKSARNKAETVSLQQQTSGDLPASEKPPPPFDLARDRQTHRNKFQFAIALWFLWLFGTDFFTLQTGTKDDPHTKVINFFLKLEGVSDPDNKTFFATAKWMNGKGKKLLSKESHRNLLDSENAEECKTCFIKNVVQLIRENKIEAEKQFKEDQKNIQAKTILEQPNIAEEDIAEFLSKDLTRRRQRE